MAITYWIEKEKKRIQALVVGKFTMEDIIQTIYQVTADPNFQAGFDILSDHTGIEEVITTEQIKITTSHLTTLSHHFTGSRWAVVTTRDASFGMMRMFSIYLEKILITLKVFRSITQAEKWLVSARRNQIPVH